MSIKDQNMDQRETQKVARRMQEIIENKEEVAKCLFRYMGPAIVTPQCMLCGGDYMVFGNGALTSARGAQIPISAEELVSFIDGGHLSHVFDPTDINSSDFAERMNTILEAMNLQSKYQDAPVYYQFVHEDCALAAYESGTPDRIAGVLRVGTHFALHNGISKKDDMFKDSKECTYEEFNPGGKEIQDELEKTVNQETQNKSSKYQEMKQMYQQNGENRVPSVGEISQDKSLSAKDRLNAMKEAQEQMQEQTDMQNQIDHNEEELTPLSTSKAMRYMQ